ncbi:MAG: carboxy terminal-processing peptidase [Saprospirales bacterium]|nr:carboxy terminal-processing peptidase [Saprospirales bacterium]
METVLAVFLLPRGYRHRFFLNRLLPVAGNDPNPQKEARLIQAILFGLERYHYQPKKVDDQFSRAVYDLYLQNIDGGKRFFIQPDIDQLKSYETQLDDQAIAGSFEFFDRSVLLLDASLAKTQGWYRELLAAPFDFSREEMFDTDGEKSPWAKTDAELRSRWEKWMKYEVLSRVNEELGDQEKPEYKGEKKSFETIETEVRKKVLDIYDKWFRRMQKNDRSRQLEVYLNAVINVFDPHSGYFSPKERADFDYRMSGKLEGIGARLQSDGEKTTVTEIVPGGPAWKQGELEPKDVIIKVAQGGDEAVDVMGWELDDVVAIIRGAKGTTVKLTTQKPDGAVKVISIVRDVVITEEAMAKSLIISTEDNPGKVGYIFLPKFYADFTPEGATSCAEDVAKELEKLKSENVQGIILDLRNNGGGSLRDVVRMSGFFIEQGPVVQVKSRGRPADINADSDPRVQYGGPLIVMVNGFSASASEILAAAMQDYGRAVVVGTTGTYGKGTVQRFWDLDLATSEESIKPLGDMKVTIQKFYRITGKTTQLDGVKPDIVLPDSYNYVDLGERENDYPLEATTIEAAPFQQGVYHIADLAKLQASSSVRVKADPTFSKIEENAQRLRRQKNMTRFPLQLEAFQAWDRKMEEEASQFDKMLQPISAFQVANLTADAAHIQSDTSRMTRNDSWLKERQKDIQLYEALRVMQDMIRIDALAARK